jgi:hypothetical protein
LPNANRLAVNANSDVNRGDSKIMLTGFLKTAVLAAAAIAVGAAPALPDMAATLKDSFGAVDGSAYRDGLAPTKTTTGRPYMGWRAQRLHQ